jgi:hypothetical protein
MTDQLFTENVVSPLMILSISCVVWGYNGCLGRGGYSGIKRAGTGGRSRMGKRGKRKGCEA